MLCCVGGMLVVVRVCVCVCVCVCVGVGVCGDLCFGDVMSFAGELCIIL